MPKTTPKKVRQTIVKLRDQEGLSWTTIAKEIDLHRETVRKQYLLEKGKGASPLTAEKAPVPTGQTAQERSSVKQRLELLAKRQKVQQVIGDYVAVIEGEEWDYVEDEIVLLKQRLDFLKGEAENAKDVDILNETEGLVSEEIEKLLQLAEEQAQAEKRSRERERQRKLDYIKGHYLQRDQPKKDVTKLVHHLVKHGGIEKTVQFVKNLEAMEDLRWQCLASGIDSRFVEDVLSFSSPKVPTIAYVRQLWSDSQRICQQFGWQEFVSFWRASGRFIVQQRQSLWLTFLAWKGWAQPAWASYQLLPQ